VEVSDGACKSHLEAGLMLAMVDVDKIYRGGIVIGMAFEVGEFYPNQV
jgi:hypothetical protein